MKRVFSVFIAAVMLCATFTSCGGGVSDELDVTTDSDSSVTQSEEPDLESESDNNDELDGVTSVSDDTVFAETTTDEDGDETSTPDVGADSSEPSSGSTTKSDESSKAGDTTTKASDSTKASDTTKSTTKSSSTAATTTASSTTASSGGGNSSKGKKDISGLTSKEVVGMMTAGWNLGNTLDSHWSGRPWGTITTSKEQETLWGNPVTTKKMIDEVKASGYNTVRIPVTWYIFTGDAPNYKIDGAWMNRVQEVVDYVIDNGMFCILNIHHDDYSKGSNWENGWLRLYYYEGGVSRALKSSEKEEINKRFAAVWKQIAQRFKDYDEYLIFEGINEPRTVGMDNPTKKEYTEQADFLNELLQTFVDTVRKTGGKNRDRHLMVTPYNASVGMDPNDGDGRIAAFVNSKTGKLYVNDSKNRLIVSLHYYEPWGFVMAPTSSQWYSAYFDMSVGSVSYNVNNVLKIIKDNFTSKGIPVIMGETGAIHRNLPDGKSNEGERVKWAKHYVGELKKIGVPVVIWDDGGDYKLFDRKNVKWAYPKLSAAIVEASKG